jgi:predicted 3-demethylubiquinone-9 3-methyltransferase (glyoxalase superfamily)
MGKDMQKIVPFLWFDTQAEEAAKFYVSIFKNSKLGTVTRYGAAGPGRKGSVMSVTFRLEGQPFYALNGGPVFTFTPAISFFVDCKTQKEVDDLWRRLTRGGEPGQCGWLKDRFGVSWQIVPAGLGKLIRDPAVMKEMLTMSKLDIERLRAAAATGGATSRTRRRRTGR